MKDFLDSRSMLTPGALGALVAMLTAAVSSQLGASAAWTALLLSFVCGLLVLADSKVALPQRVAFYVVNSLIIFAVAAGTNQLGVAATDGGRPADRPAAQAELGDTPFFHSWF